MYCKRYLKAEKGDFQCLYAPIISINSIYRKDENYYPKVFLEKTLFSWRHRTFL